MAHLSNCIGLSSDRAWVVRTLFPGGRKRADNEIDTSTSTSKVDLSSVADAFARFLKSWALPSAPTSPLPLSEVPSSLPSPEEDDPDATCVATDTEFHEVLKAINAVKRPSRSSSSSRSSIRKHSKTSSLAIKTSPPAHIPHKLEGHLTASPISIQQEVSYAQSPVESCRYVEGGDHACSWKEQVRRVQAEASSEKAIGGQIIHSLRRRLVCVEEEAKGSQHALCEMEAQLGLRDMYIRALLRGKGEAEKRQAAWERRAAVAESCIEDYHQKLDEREAEIVDQQAEITSLKKLVRDWEGRHMSFAEEARSEIEGLKGTIQQLKCEMEAKQGAINALEEEKTRLEDLSVSNELRASENEATISELKRDRDRSRGIRMEDNSVFKSMQESIAEKEERIADLKGRLTESHRRLVRLSSGDVKSATQERYEIAQTHREETSPKTEVSSPMPTTPAYERLKELSSSFARATGGGNPAATVIFPLQRASCWR